MQNQKNQNQNPSWEQISVWLNRTVCCVHDAAHYVEYLISLSYGSLVQDLDGIKNVVLFVFSQKNLQ